MANYQALLPDLPFRCITVVRDGKTYLAVAAGEKAILENGVFAQHDPSSLAAAEGVTWVHGHHAPDSQAAKSLLAAWALARDTGPTGPTGPQGPTGYTGVTGAFPGLGAFPPAHHKRNV